MLTTSTDQRVWRCIQTNRVARPYDMSNHPGGNQASHAGLVRLSDVVRVLVVLTDLPAWAPYFVPRGHCRAASRRPRPPAPRAPDGRPRMRRTARRSACAFDRSVSQAPPLDQHEVSRSDTPTHGSWSPCPLSSELDGTPRVRCTVQGWRRQRRRRGRRPRRGDGSDVLAPRRSRRSLLQEGPRHSGSHQGWAFILTRCLACRSP